MCEIPGGTYLDFQSPGFPRPAQNVLSLQSIFLPDPLFFSLYHFWSCPPWLFCLFFFFFCFQYLGATYHVDDSVSLISSPPGTFMRLFSFSNVPGRMETLYLLVFMLLFLSSIGFPKTHKLILLSNLIALFISSWYYWTSNIYFFQRLYRFSPGPYCICLKRMITIWKQHYC